MEIDWSEPDEAGVLWTCGVECGLSFVISPDVKFGKTCGYVLLIQRPLSDDECNERMAFDEELVQLYGESVEQLKEIVAALNKLRPVPTKFRPRVVNPQE